MATQKVSGEHLYFRFDLAYLLLHRGGKVELHAQMFGKATFCNLQSKSFLLIVRLLACICSSVISNCKKRIKKTFSSAIVHHL